MADAKDPRRIVLTGAAGGIGTMTRRLLAGLYPGLVLSDRVEPKDLQPGETFVAADLTRPDEVAAALEGADSVIHLGGHSVEGTWDQILQANIIGCYNVFEAAREAGVKRVIFASSNHAIGFYPRRKRIGTDVTVRPDIADAEAGHRNAVLVGIERPQRLAEHLADAVATVGPLPLDVRRLSIWISPRDLVQLFQIGLDHPDLRYEIFYGASDNAAGWWDNSRAHRFGYRPQDKAEDHRAHAEAEQAKIGPDPVGDLFQGGSFCSAEFTNDVKRAGP